MPHAAWTELEAVARRDADARISDQFAADRDRLSRLTVDAAGLHLDLSKQSWTHAGFDAALALARAADLDEPNPLADPALARYAMKDDLLRQQNVTTRTDV